jgi:hypothetical protein
MMKLDLEDSKVVDGVTVYRLLIDGKLWGHVESLKNVGSEAKVVTGCVVMGNAYVGSGHIRGDSKISGNVQVLGNSIINNSTLTGNVQVDGGSLIDNSSISGNVIVAVGTKVEDSIIEVEDGALILSDDTYVGNSWLTESGVYAEFNINKINEKQEES